MSLQRKLSLSHLTIAIVSALLIAGLTIGGYWAYSQTDWSALWVADVALQFADEIALDVDDFGASFDQPYAEEFVNSQFGYVSYRDGELEPVVLSDDEQAIEEWIVVTDLAGTILGSSYPQRFPVGERITAVQTPGIARLWPLDSNVRVLPRYAEVAFAKSAENYVALAPIVTFSGGETLGYVYYRADNSQARQILQDTTQILGAGLAGATLITIVVSGFMGSRLARSLAQRITQLTQASDAYAAGDFSQRVQVTGKDEIARLSAEFNRMAAQIETQFDAARDLARLEERNRLARDLHDAVKQQLFGLNLTVGSIPALLDRDADKARKRLVHASDLTQRILEEMDSVIKQLRPASLGDRGLAAALDELTQQWENQTGVPVAYTAIEARELPLKTEQAVFRIAQEALNNIARHARASQVIVSLEYDVGELRLMVADDGKGFDVDREPPPESHGLRNMRERSAEIGGTLKMTSQLNKGSAIHLRLPIADGLQ